MATSRRSFLRTAPLAAAAVSLAPSLEAQSPSTPTQKPLLVTATELTADIKKLHASPGNNNLFLPTDLPLNVVLTVEDKKSAKEFEWHEGRDHIVQILEGETLYEVGGTPAGGRNTKPGEWLAPSATGATTYTLRKGDMLIIPRNTLHKRSTAGSVTFVLISTPGVVK